MRLLARIQQGLVRRPAIAVVMAAGAMGAVASSSPAASPPSSVAALQGRVTSLQSDLNVRRTQLLRVRGQLDAAERRLGSLEAAKAAAERRLGGLEAAKAAAEHVLAEQLVGSYEGGRPDIISVVVESNGSPNLLDRLAFAERIGRQDVRIVSRVRSVRQAVAIEATTLGRLTARAQRVADRVRSERDQVARYRLKLVAQQLAAAQAKAAAAGSLASAQVPVGQLTQQLGRLRASPAPVPANGGAGPAPGSTRADIAFPIPPGAAAPPATWSLGDGVDIAAAAGTPELAVCSGTVVLQGIGGMGPSAPVLRCDQPLAGHAYVYYGFAGPQGLAAIGSDVVRGQPLARVGAGIIANSTGPHLEIGFADSSGAPVGPATAHQMLTLLDAAYAS